MEPVTMIQQESEVHQHQKHHKKHRHHHHNQENIKIDEEETMREKHHKDIDSLTKALT